MMNIGKQITLEKGKDELKVHIRPPEEHRSNKMLLFWLLGWTFCGLAIVFQMFYNKEQFGRKEYMFFGIYLSLWLYFELKVLYAYRWNKWGYEEIEIKEDKFSYCEYVGKRGLPRVYALDEVYPLSYVSATEKGLWNDINRSAWMVGGAVIEYQAKGGVKRLGRKLEKKDAEKLVALVNKYLPKG